MNIKIVELLPHKKEEKYGKDRDKITETPNFKTKWTMLIKYF